MRRLLPLVLGLLLFPAAAGGCGGKDPAAGGPVKIGVAGPITGAEAKNGQDLAEGATLAMEEWNAKGGVLGRKVELVVRDDEALDKNATVVASELVDAGVAGVIGHFNSGCTLPASEIYHEHKVPMITPASTNVRVTDRKYPEIFRVCGRDDDQGATAAEFVATVLKVSKVAVLDDRSAYGKGLADGFTTGLGDRATVVAREGFDKNETNFRPYLNKAKSEGAELIYFGGIYTQAAPLILQAREIGITVPFMSGDGVHGYQADFIDKLAAKAEGTYTTFPDTESAPGYAAFVKKYEERFKAKAGPYAIFSYSCAQVILKAVETAGTTDGAKVAAAIHAGSFETPVGTMKFDAKGDVKVEYKVFVVKDGKHVLAVAK
jgi:branched-chain amino acid transport system substrate-binding protein